MAAFLSTLSMKDALEAKVVALAGVPGGPGAVFVVLFHERERGA